MRYLEDWLKISARIKSLMNSTEICLGFLKINSGDGFKMGKRLFEQCQIIFEEIKKFSQSYSGNLPIPARQALDNFIAKNDQFLTNADGSKDTIREKYGCAISILIAFDGEITYLLSDKNEFIRRRSELAFVHLQRSIVVDESFREKWKQAYEINEMKCEKLGAIHLLSHGIWAFKVDAAGARTDLVFEETPLSGDIIQKSAEGLVLTEWKSDKNETDCSNNPEGAEFHGLARG